MRSVTWVTSQPWPMIASSKNSSTPDIYTCTIVEHCPPKCLFVSFIFDSVSLFCFHAEKGYRRNMSARVRIIFATHKCRKSKQEKRKSHLLNHSKCDCCFACLPKT